jgi:hypothetical protein
MGTTTDLNRYFRFEDGDLKEVEHSCDDYVLNPDAVAVKWFKCKLCGRTRKEIVNKEVW